MTDNDSINNFRNYLKIASVHPNVNYDECVKFLLKQSQSLNLASKIIEVVPLKPIVVLTWSGKKPELPSILLNSHMDVVPVFDEYWIHKPFDGYYDSQSGKIYGRGAQDMKSVGIQYLEAIRLLKQENVQLNRTVHVSFVPDEEIGGMDGVMKWVSTESFQDLNVGLILDEGMPSETETFYLFNGERTVWKVRVNCSGSPGHGSLLLKDTAGEKLRRVLDYFMDYRESQVKKFEADPHLTVGDVTTINLTKIEGGKQNNVVPPVLSVVFDVRISLNDDIGEFVEMITDFCRKAGKNIEIEYEQQNEKVEPTPIGSKNAWWNTFKKSCDDLGIKIETRIFPGGTDGRFFRAIGLPVFGFSPINNTPVLLHDHNEFLEAKVFLRGIQIYKKIINDLALCN